MINRLIRFFTLNSNTHKSIFNEGQRRVVFIASMIVPFILAYIYFYDFEKNRVISDWYFGFPISYFIFHITILVYIWVREGNGNVNPGGNALITLKNLVYLIMGIFVILIAILLAYEKLYLPYKREDNMFKTCDKFYQCLTDNDLVQLDYIIDDSYLNGKQHLLNAFRDYLEKNDLLEWRNESLVSIDGTTVKGVYHIKIANKNKIEDKVKTITFKFVHYDASFPYDCKIIDFKGE